MVGLVVSLCYGGHSVEETPGSIPNPEAKLDCADGTALGRVWESRSPPDIFVGVGVSWRPLRVSLLPLPFFMPKIRPARPRQDGRTARRGTFDVFQRAQLR